MSNLMLVYLGLIVAGFVSSMLMDGVVLAVISVGNSIIWAAFHLGEQLNERLK